MTVSTVPTDKAREEAASWFARLKTRDVPGADMEAFRLWRKEAGHKEAYDEVVRLWRESETLKDRPAIQDALAGARARAGIAPKAGAQRISRRPVLGLGLAIGLVAVIGAGAYFGIAPRGYTTLIGEQRVVRLADGSTIRLDTGSRVLVRYGSSRRDIQLVRGQALFDVSHDAARPFVVQAGDISVTALGTRFDVRRQAAGAQVTLVRGAVEVKDAGGGTVRAWRLAPGQAITTHARLAMPMAVDVASATSWTEGRLVFQATPLLEAVTEVNRYSRDRIVIDGERVAQATISGVFDAGDTETFVDSVAQARDLTVTRPEKGVIQLSQARAGDAYP